MGFGFELAESMTGTYHLFAAPLVTRALHASLTLEVNGLRRFARRRAIAVRGWIRCEGLAGEAKPLHGTVAWRLIEEKRVPYELAFEGDDGATYHLRGQRDFFVHNVLGSLTTMEASVYDAASTEIGRAVVRFEPPMELWSLLRTFRPRVRLAGWFGSDED